MVLVTRVRKRISLNCIKDLEGFNIYSIDYIGWWMRRGEKLNWDEDEIIISSRSEESR